MEPVKNEDDLSVRGWIVLIIVLLVLAYFAGKAKQDQENRMADKVIERLRKEGR